MNLRNLASRAWPILPAIVAAIWFSAIAHKILPQCASEWGLAVELTSSQSGEARLYWETADGLSQERSVSLPISDGKRQKLFYPLPRDIELTGFRFDFEEIDIGTQITIDRIETVGPMGFWFPEKPGAKGTKAQLDAELEESEDGQLKVTITGADSQLRISVNPKPLPAPVAEFGRAKSIIGWIAFVVFATLFIAITMFAKLRETLLYLVGLGWAVYLICHYVLPIKAIHPSWFYHVLFAPSLFLAILSAPKSWPHLSRFLKHPPMWALAAFVVYFGISALGLSGETEPAQNTVLLNLGILLIAPALFLFLRDHFRFDEAWPRLIWIGVATVMAIVVFVKCYLIVGDNFSSRLAQTTAFTPGKGEPGFTPLFRIISGTACFAIVVILGAAWADRSKPNWKRIGIYLAIAAPILFYVLFSQSRGVIFALLFALIVLSIAPRAWTSRVIAGVYALLIALFMFADIPGLLDSIGKQPEPAAAVVAAEPEPTDGGIKKRPSGRRAIYERYLEAIGEKPVFGHGFGAKQKLLVELDESLFADHDAHLANAEWNPHSVHLSVLYFGGGVGFLIHVALLGSICILALLRCLKRKNWSYLLSAAWVIFAAAAVTTESTLMAYDKDPVLLRYPNEYWIFYWGAIVFGVIQTALKPEELAADCKTDAQS